jgi:ABC-type nitrate/sulfonate/bicarbonate transport system substrate-binding protein
LSTVPATVVLTTVGLLEENSDLITGFLRATAKGYTFVHANPEAGLAILRAVHPDQFTDEVADEIFHLNRPLTNPPDGIYGSGNTLETWTTYFEFIQVELPAGVDLEEIVNDELVDAANDFDREAVVEEANSYSG